jgi:hypothetical protein
MNLLPSEEKEILKRGFRIRVFVLLNIFLTIFFIAASIFLIPSYFLAKEQLEVISSFNTSIKPEDEESINKTLLVPTELQNKISFFETNLGNKKASDAISDVVSLKNSGIKINSMFFNKVAQGTEAEVLMVVSGIAERRDSLISFQSALRDSGKFQSVDVPVSSLAKDRDLPFSINLKISREKNEKLDS